MASTRKRNNRWEVRVRRSGYPTQTKTFTHKSSVQTWGREAELALEQGRLRSRACLSDLRFHDLRHEAISRFLELGLNIPEVAVISGHKDPRMLFRYTHLRAEELVGRL